jgi:DNA-binding MarR family transcriptional regulator
MRRNAVPSPFRSNAAAAVDAVDTSFLETLLGYNARRAALAVIDVFLEAMGPYQLKPVDFSVLSLITHNPGITSRQLCSALGILPPNLVGMVNNFEQRQLVERLPHPRDGRAMGLHLTAAGEKLMQEAEKTAAAVEAKVASRLSAGELRTLIQLLQKIYQPA